MILCPIIVNILEASEREKEDGKCVDLVPALELELLVKVGVLLALSLLEEVYDGELGV